MKEALPSTPRPDPASLPGYILAREGAGMLDELFPDRSTRKAASKRLLARAQSLIFSDHREYRSVGFWLLGLAQAAGGQRRGQ